MQCSHFSASSGSCDGEWLMRLAPHLFGRSGTLRSSAWAKQRRATAPRPLPSTMQRARCWSSYRVRPLRRPMTRAHSRLAIVRLVAARDLVSVLGDFSTQ